MKKLMYAAMLLLGLSILSSCVNNKPKKMAEGYEWLEGTWTYDAWFPSPTVLKITPEYFQCVREDLDETLNPDTAEKQSYKIKVVHNESIGDAKALVENCGADNEYAYFYIDDKEKRVYFLWDFDVPEYMTKQ